MPDGDSSWKAGCTRGCPSYGRRLYYEWATFIIKIIKLYYLAMDISVNNHTKLYIYAEMLRSYPCTCIWVKLKKKLAGNAMRNTSRFKCPSPPTCAI